jgi:flagellar motor switch/type III secretory pathway protein FliN
MEPPARRIEDERDPKVRLRLFATMPKPDQVVEGERIVVDELVFDLPEVGIVGRGVWGGEHMTMEVEERSDVCEQQVPGVRLDLGEIEVRLSDLVALRPGAVLDLGGASLERCYVRVGSTILAEGRFTTCEGKLTLTIEAVV